MFHVHAWGLPYVATMLGVKQVYPGRYVPDVLLGLIGRESVTFSHCVPTILQMMLGSPALRDVDLRRLEGDHRRLGAAAAARARRGRARHRHHRGLRHVGDLPDPHARASAPRRCSTGMPSAGCRTLCRAGRPIPFVQLRIVDADMNDVAHDGASQGEVVVRAPWLTQGYLDEPERSDELWRGGWLHTGDVGVIDADGYLQDRRPHQGRREDRRRVGLVARPRGHDPARPRRRRGRCRRRARREVGRAARSRSSWSRRAPTAPTEDAIRRHVAELRRARRDLEVRGARPRALRRRDPEDQRRQARQEGDPREARRKDGRCIGVATTRMLNRHGLRRRS